MMPCRLRRMYCRELEFFAVIFGEGVFFGGRRYEDPIFVNFLDEKKFYEGMTRFWALLSDPCGGTMRKKMWKNMFLRDVFFF